MKKYLFFLFVIFFSVFSFGQTNNDSLLIVFNTTSNPDSVRLEAIFTYTWKYVYTSPDSAIVFAKKALVLAKEKNQKKFIAKALNAIGACYSKKSQYPKAISYFQQSLKIREEINDKKGEASTLVNIGVVYMYLENYTKSLEYYFKALTISNASGNKNEAALAYTNIAIIYHNQKKLDGALDNNFKALKLYEEMGDVNSSANSLMGIGKSYFSLSNFPKAHDYYMKAQKIFKDVNNVWAHSLSMVSVGELYSKQNQSDKAIQEFLSSLKIAKELGDLDTQMGVNSLLYNEYKKSGNNAQALQSYEQYIFLKDSVYNIKNQKEIIQKELNYEFEKKDAVSKAVQDKKDALAKEKEQNQKIILYAFVGGFLIVIIFSFVLIRRYRITQKQKKIIEDQRDFIEEQQKGVVESITYAKRIQDAILPPIHLIQEKFPNSFVLYKPKDIVAGDFYWLEEIGDTILIAAADCTGHGVPGAMVSVVCSNALNRAVKEFHVSEPGKILDKVLELVLETFEKSVSKVNDGMDISLLAFNKSSKQIQWSGANSPLWFFENNQLIEIKGNKQPIGKSDMRNPFTTHTIEHKTGMLFYLFTDGYSDQFGGPKGKKLKDKPFQEILLSVLRNDSLSQKKELNTAFESWRGKLEQVDDVCVIGITI